MSSGSNTTVKSWSSRLIQTRRRNLLETCLSTGRKHQSGRAIFWSYARGRERNPFTLSLHLSASRRLVRQTENLPEQANFSGAEQQRRWRRFPRHIVRGILGFSGFGKLLQFGDNIVLGWELTRAGAIASASPYREPGHSFVDLDQGIFYRLAIGRRATKKRQSPAPIPPRLLAHMRRWVRRGIVTSHFVEWHGAPVNSVKTGFKHAVSLAGLWGRVTPHTLRHTLRPG